MVRQVRKMLTDLWRTTGEGSRERDSDCGRRHSIPSTVVMSSSTASGGALLFPEHVLMFTKYIARRWHIADSDPGERQAKFDQGKVDKEGT